MSFGGSVQHQAVCHDDEDSEVLVGEGVAFVAAGSCYNLDAAPVAVAEARVFDAAGPGDFVQRGEGAVFDEAGPSDEVEPEDGSAFTPSAGVSEAFTVVNA